MLSMVPAVSTKYLNVAVPKNNVLIEELPVKIEEFQKGKGKWITPNCQFIQKESICYYGIHKNHQAQETNEKTRKIYQDLKLHILQQMGLPANFGVVQVVGDSATFSQDGTKLGKAFLKRQLSENAVIQYGYTGNRAHDGTRCVNGLVTDIIEENNMKSISIGNLVAFHTPSTLKQSSCSVPELEHYIVVYGDDESCRERGTLFGDDVITSDFLADSLIMLEGGAQSFRQACNALLLDQNITVLSGLRATEKTYTLHEGKITPLFGAAKFLNDIAHFVSEYRGTISENDLQKWFEDYFGNGKCYIVDPTRKDYDTKQKLLTDAWNLFISEKLYLKIEKLVNFQNVF